MKIGYLWLVIIMALGSGLSFSAVAQQEAEILQFTVSSNRQRRASGNKP